MRSTPSASRSPLLRAFPSLVLIALLGSALPAAAADPDPTPGLGLMEAVQLMLAHDPNLGIIEARLSSSQGSLLSASGLFDPVVQSSAAQIRTDAPASLSSRSEQRRLESSLGFTQRFRTGLSITPQVDLVRTEDLLDGTPGVNLGTVGFQIRQPLLRGRGRAATAAVELSAERELAASRLDVRQTLSERVLTLLRQYWSYKAAALNLDILLESESRSRELMETTRRLIEADVTPAAELVQIEANLAAQEASRIAGERDLFEARQSLGREIGLDYREIGALDLPADAFPAVAASAVPAALPAPSQGAPGIDRYVAAALARRDDLRAARERQQGVEALIRAAENALKPQVDLVFRPSYTGLVEGTGLGDFYSPLFRNVPGVSSSFSLSLGWPTANRQARGSLLQTQAALAESRLFVESVAKAIGADVPTALDAVARQAQRLEKAEEAVGLYERTVFNEERKLRAGTSTLIDVINQRDRLTAARQQRVAAQLALALAIADLRFQTGTLLAPAGDPANPAATASRQDGAIEQRRLTTLPTPEEAAP
ncbi:MAG TPA: TolC family protein [Thermoanaerobaculia bacterium]|nr:TolC family protein [Thermoanaerobaculia bacterium]